MTAYLKIFPIGKVSYVDIQGSGSLVGIGIVYNQSLELVGELDNPVGTVVEVWFFELGGQNEGAAPYWEGLWVLGCRHGR